MKLNFGRNQKICFAFLFALAGCILAFPAWAVDLSNPLGSVTDIRELVGRIIAAIIGIIGAIALLYFVYGGVLLLTSQGNTEQIRKGKDTLIWAILGIAVVIASYAFLARVIQGLTSSGAT